jgi:large subunit ribosomal protein L23
MGIFSKKNKDDKADKKEVKEVAAKKAVVKEEKPKAKPVPKEKATKKVAKTTKPVVTKGSGEAYRVLLRPIISEKATLGASLNKYVFEVATSTNKVEIKKAISEIYGVVPASINILNKRGKNVRRGRHWGTTRSVKKAVVTLKKGDSIKLYEGI